MTKLYKDMTTSIYFEIDPEIEKQVKGYCLKYRIINVVILLSDILAGILAIYGVHKKEYAWFLAFIPVFALIFYNRNLKYKEYNRINILSNEGCQVQKALSGHITLLGQTKRMKKTESNVYSVGILLCYLGRLEDCKKVIALLEQYFDTVVGRVYELILLMNVAYYEKNEEIMESYLKELELLLQDKKLLQMRGAFQMVSKYPDLLAAEKAGDYQCVEELQNLSPATDARMKQVVGNYRLYKTARNAGMNKAAEQHCEFVLKYGGDTFYKKELETVK